MELKKFYEKDDKGCVIFKNKEGDILLKNVMDDASVIFKRPDNSRHIESYYDNGAPAYYHKKEAPKGFSPKVTGVQVTRIPKNSEQRFTPRLLEMGRAENWLAKTDTHIIIHCVKHGDHKFKIINVPERVCLHCGEKLPWLDADKEGVLARKHIQEEHKGKVSPDKSNPSGYVCNNYFETKVEG